MERELVMLPGRSRSGACRDFTNPSSRQQDAIRTAQRQAPTSRQHPQLMAQDEDLDITRDVVRLAAPGEQTQQAADGEVDKR